MNEQVKAVDVLDWLYGLQKKKKIDLGHAERRENVRPDELDSLKKKLKYIDYLIERTIKEL